MTRLWYLANIRLPTEKAHGYQIMQMCEAFAEAGAQVRLLHADRRNRPELARVTDVWAHYGVARLFEREKVPCVDWYRAIGRWPRPVRGLVERFVSRLQLLSYTLALVVRLNPVGADILYSRDSVPLLALAALRPRLRRRLLYEAHEFPATTLGRWLRRRLVRQVAGVVVITRHLADLYQQELGVPGRRLLVAPDGVRLERFANLGDRAACRARLGLPADGFIVGYVGQLHLMGMSKGVDTLAAAVALLWDEHRQRGDERPLRLCVVGGPDEKVAELKAQTAAHGLPGDLLVAPGQVRPHDVPLWMRAFDVCTLPSPWKTFLAYYTSPLKLFEYMASGTPILASDLPAYAEIVRHEQSALLIPPGDPAALAEALCRLRDDPALGARLAGRARQDVTQYTWRARAESLLAFAGDRVA